LRTSSTKELPASPENTATEQEQRHDCAVLCTARLAANYWNSKAADPLGFAEAVAGMFARFPVHIQMQALTELPKLYPTWLPQAGEVYQVCEGIAQAEWRRQQRESNIKAQLEARRADEAAGLLYLRPKAITGPAPVAPPLPRKPSDTEHEARDSLVRAIWREVADGAIDETEAQRRIDALPRPP
jgi:hypothetical protein